MMMRKQRNRYKSQDINPEEIFIDSENLPNFDNDQFEGRMEKPISVKSILFIGSVFMIVSLLFAFKAWGLQVARGDEFREISENNHLRHILVFANRGVVYDRNKELLAWNVPRDEDREYDTRKYTDRPGFSNMLGYVKYPQKDKFGFYYDEEFTGINGIEKEFGDRISGVNGLQIVEVNAQLKATEGSVIRPPQHGESLTLTIDSEIQEQLYKSIEKIVNEAGFVGGGGVIMDVTNGEIIALTTYPEFDSNVLTDGSDVEKIEGYFSDERNPFLNRIISGLYTPGSIVKPYMALAGLTEGVITEFTKILSTGSISIPNVYDPSNPSIFNDWKAHGYVDVREAIAHSSNVFFYEVGGGYKDQKGIGIANIEKYMRLFGFGDSNDSGLFAGPSGTIPNPEWKAENFDGDPWRVGDTYFTSIGQYGFQVTPFQVIRALGAIANGGTLYQPKILKDEPTQIIRQINEIPDEYYQVVREGMREGALVGSARGLNMKEVEIAAKTGTAELGVSKANVNSWVTGFFPYENPKYAFAIVMERGRKGNLIGGVAVARGFFDWVKINRPDFIGLEPIDL